MQRRSLRTGCAKPPSFNPILNLELEFSHFLSLLAQTQSTRMQFKNIPRALWQGSQWANKVRVMEPSKVKDGTRCKPCLVGCVEAVSTIYHVFQILPPYPLLSVPKRNSTLRMLTMCSSYFNWLGWAGELKTLIILVFFYLFFLAISWLNREQAFLDLKVWPEWGLACWRDIFQLKTNQF